MTETSTRKKPEIDNKPESILSAWIALEVLAPHSFIKPEELTGGNKSRITNINKGQLPWEGEGSKPPEGKEIFYHVVLGTINMELAFQKIMEFYSDDRAERPSIKGEAFLASIVVDKEGRPVHEPVSAVASFGWGLSRVLQKDVNSLGGWRDEEERLKNRLDDILHGTDGSGNKLPLTRTSINKAYKWLIDDLDLPERILYEPRIAVKVIQSAKKVDVPDPILLNSFFMKDLVDARIDSRKGDLTENLQLYLGEKKPKEIKDLLADSEVLEDAISPEKFPLSCWAGQGHHSLSLLQQAGVNLAMNDLKDGGILAINGPPGTGKTTLLRDIVADVVTNRAKAMAKFDNPADAFHKTNEKVSLPRGKLNIHEVDKSLRGFEIVIASSNNKAVENVSAELPAIDSIADDVDLRYFKTVSDKLLGRESWGLIAAVLGNSDNRYRFKQDFWWDKECGFQNYLFEVAGNSYNSEKGEEKKRPKVVENENPPIDSIEALERWKSAKANFNEAISKVEKELSEIGEARKIVLQISKIKKEKETPALQAIKDAKKHVDKAAKILKEQEKVAKDLLDNKQDIADEVKIHLLSKPQVSLWERLLTWLLRESNSNYSQWYEEKLEKKKILKKIEDQFKDAKAKVKEMESGLKKLEEILEIKKTKLERVKREIEEISKKLDPYRERLGDALIDENFAERSHEEKQSLSPWLDEKTYRLRENVFIEAMNLHKAFIDTAAKPLRHNIGALMNVWENKSKLDSFDYLPDLWSSLFFVVPSISTTFASVERMMEYLPREAFGWLLIDEAGQALPQAAVGAIKYTKRAVVVGDPIQIEPVVTLPESLTKSICREFGVDHHDYNAPIASTQTLADAATSYVAEFVSEEASRTVGVPLLVHRRCADPMFSIANAVAYGNLMISKKVEKNSDIRNCLGESKWFDVQGTAQDKWCPQEGELVLDLLQKLKEEKIEPDLYIVTPFVNVQDNLRNLIRKSGIMDDWVKDYGKWIYNRIGTVHTVQGREAEAVIFVLGATSDQKKGARGWAGGRPNLLNVAVTRAKEVLYVVGNRKVWKNAGVFKELDLHL